MGWNRRYAITSYLRSTIWTAPLIALVVEQVTFRLAYLHQFDFGWLPGFVFDRDGTVAVGDYVISSSIAFIVFTFGSLLVAIQIAGGQLTPRIIVTALLPEKTIRRSVAVFIFALLLAGAVKSRVDTIPHFLVSVTAILGLVSVVVFMFLIDHAARLMRPVNIVGIVARQGFKVIADVYPEVFRSEVPLSSPMISLGPAQRTVSHKENSAIVIAVNARALIAQAIKHDVVIELVPRVGDFVSTDEPLFLLRGPGAQTVDARRLRDQVAFGPERTIEQDSAFAFRVIVDIALKALSPAINDPTTAVLAIDQVQRLLRSVGNRDLRNERIFGPDNALRLIFRTPDWEDFVHLSFSEIRQCGAGSFQVVRRLRAMIEALMQNLPAERLAAIRLESELLERTIEKFFPLPEDLNRARVADTQGMGGASP
jgi:uncharacterized membrane protein